MEKAQNQWNNYCVNRMWGNVMVKKIQRSGIKKTVLHRILVVGIGCMDHLKWWKSHFKEMHGGKKSSCWISSSSSQTEIESPTEASHHGWHPCNTESWSVSLFPLTLSILTKTVWFKNESFSPVSDCSCTLQIADYFSNVFWPDRRPVHRNWHEISGLNTSARFGAACLLKVLYAKVSHLN